MPKKTQIRFTLFEEAVTALNEASNHIDFDYKPHVYVQRLVMADLKAKGLISSSAAPAQDGSQSAVPINESQGAKDDFDPFE